MNCPRCATPTIQEEKWASRCPGCGHVQMTRRSFLIGALSAVGLVATGVGLATPEPDIAVPGTEDFDRILREIYEPGVRNFWNARDPTLRLLQPKMRRHGMSEVQTQMLKFQINRTKGLA